MNRGYDANDVAKFILQKREADVHPINNLGLNALLFFAQREYLAHCRQPLFEEPIIAAEWGPMVPQVYFHYSSYGDRPIPGPDPPYSSPLPERVQLCVAAIVCCFPVIGRSQLLEHATRPGGAWERTYDETPCAEIPLARLQILR